VAKLDWIKKLLELVIFQERDVSEDFDAWRCARLWFTLGEWREQMGYVIGGFSWLVWVAWLCSLSGGLRIITCVW